MNNEIHIIEGEVWATMPGMVSLGAKLPAIKQYRARCVGDWKEINGKPVMRLNSIPEGKVKKGMLKEKQILDKYQDQYAQAAIYDALNNAQLFEFTKYLPEYRKFTDLSPLQVTQAAKRHAVFQCLLDRKKSGSKDLKNEFAAFNQIEPGRYSGTIAFSQAIKEARLQGIFYKAVDKRWFGNNKRENKKDTPHEEYVMAKLVSSPKVLTASEMMGMANPYFESQGMKIYGLTWYKQQLKKWKKNIEVYKSRYGVQEANKLMPFITAKHPDYSNVQFQIDGVVMPFWTKIEGKLKRYNVILVIDSNSKKIVGWSFGRSENTTTIMEAVRDAVNNTGVLPFEMVSDNHSFNKTKEASNLQNFFAKKGATWTVTHNAQYKAIIERYNQYLNAIWKPMYGYLGKGIRSKTLGAIPKSELLDLYAKNVLSEETIKSYAVVAINTYNNMPLKSGKTPNEQYAANLHPNPIALSNEERAELLIFQTEKKVSRNQITFTPGGVKIEFQLSAKWFSKYHNQVVIVRYDSLQDGIFIFDKETGDCIEFLYPKEHIASTKTEQTEKDIELLNQSAGRKKGIITQGRKELENLTAKLNEIDPDAIHLINKMTTPKDVVQQMQESSDMRFNAHNKELQIEAVHVPGNIDDEATSALIPVRKKQKELFTPETHTIGMINPLKQFDNL